MTLYYVTRADLGPPRRSSTCVAVLLLDRDGVLPRGELRDPLLLHQKTAEITAPFITPLKCH